MLARRATVLDTGPAGSSLSWAGASINWDFVFSWQLDSGLTGNCHVASQPNTSIAVKSSVNSCQALHTKTWGYHPIPLEVCKSVLNCVLACKRPPGQHSCLQSTFSLISDNFYEVSLSAHLFHCLALLDLLNSNSNQTFNSSVKRVNILKYFNLTIISQVWLCFYPWNSDFYLKRNTCIWDLWDLNLFGLKAQTIKLTNECRLWSLGLMSSFT